MKSIQLILVFSHHFPLYFELAGSSIFPNKFSLNKLQKQPPPNLTVINTKPFFVIPIQQPNPTAINFILKKSL
jgi:hypothetical protein